ncbi:MAG: 6-bladed beta-propeller [Candidatus Zixiibacteriota bacterium]
MSAEKMATRSATLALKGVVLILSLLTFAAACQWILEFQWFRSYYGSRGDFNKLKGPTGIVIRGYDASRDPADIFIAEGLNDRIVLLNSNSDSIVLAFGESGNGQGQFNRPLNLTVTQTSRFNGKPASEPMYIYVADSHNHRIQKFDLQGNFILEWGSYGAGDGEFVTPVGIDIDYEGDIFVADSGNHRIQVFDTLGTFLQSWGSFGSEYGEFEGPLDIAVGFTGTGLNEFDFVAVSDPGNNRVQLFSKDGKFLGSYDGVRHLCGISVAYYRATSKGQWVLALCPREGRLHTLSGKGPVVCHIVADAFDVSEYLVTIPSRNGVWAYEWLRGDPHLGVTGN